MNISNHTVLERASVTYLMICAAMPTSVPTGILEPTWVHTPAVVLVRLRAPEPAVIDNTEILEALPQSVDLTALKCLYNQLKSLSSSHPLSLNTTARAVIR